MRQIIIKNFAMKTPPHIATKQIKTILRKRYNCQAAKVSFLPIGEEAWSYIVITKDGKKYFLKVYRRSPNLTSSLQLSHILNRKQGIKQILSPNLTTDLKMKVLYGKYYIAVFDFIAGKTVEHSIMTPDQMYSLGTLLARMHTTIALVKGKYHQERFELPEINFPELLSRLMRASSSEVTVRRECAKILCANLVALRREYQQGIVALRRIEGRPIDYVICHGDPTPGNILLSTKGILYLVDVGYDNPILAPREKDLAFYLDPRFFPVLEGYKSVVKKVKLNKNLIAFYIHKWNLEGIIEYSRRILEGNASQVERHYLDVIKYYVENLNGRKYIKLWV
jgi:Ser/Thr protein kinase RdoA (MazF antagonist)